MIQHQKNVILFSFFSSTPSDRDNGSRDHQAEPDPGPDTPTVDGPALGQPETGLGRAHAGTRTHRTAGPNLQSSFCGRCRGWKDEFH